MVTRPFLRALLRGAVRRVGYAVIGVGAGVWRASRHFGPPETVDRILICRLDLLGDLLFTRPLIQALRETYPKSTITLLTLPYTAPLAAMFPELDRIVTVDTNLIRTLGGLINTGTWKQYLATSRLLRQEQFDLGISVCGRMASLWVALSGTKQRIGYAREAFPFVLDCEVPGGRYVERKHEVEYVGRLGYFAGARSDRDALELTADTAPASMIRERLLKLGVRDSDRLVVVHAGAINGSAKRWPPQYWARFADRISSETGAKVLLVGAESDQPLAHHVLSRSKAPVLSLVGTTSIPELVAVIARADLVATGDSGPLHVAVALGRPLVAAYGPTDPMVHGPFHPAGPTRVHRADIPCSPCYTMAATAECPLGDPVCMRLVTVDQMVASALDLLGSAPGDLSRSENQLLMPQQNALQDAE